MDYPKRTLGRLHQMSLVFYGEESKATKWLEKQARESREGFNQIIVQPEANVVYLLGKIHLGYLKD